jgi:hypothetical protein
VVWLARACLRLESAYQQPLYAECHDAQSIKRWVCEGAALVLGPGSQRQRELHTSSLRVALLCYGSLPDRHYIVLAAHRG